MTESRMSASGPVQKPANHLCVSAQRCFLGQHTYAPILHKLCPMIIQFRNYEPTLATCTRDVLHSNRLRMSNFLKLGKQSQGRFPVTP